MQTAISKEQKFLDVSDVQACDVNYVIVMLRNSYLQWDKNIYNLVNICMLKKKLLCSFLMLQFHVLDMNITIVVNVVVQEVIRIDDNNAQSKQ